MLALILAAGILLRLSFFNATDIVWDEAWYLGISYKLAYLFSLFPAAAIALAVFFGLFAYMAMFRRHLLFVGVTSALLLAVKYLFQIPVVLHERHPPLFNIIAAYGILASGAEPAFVGGLISLVSSVALAVSAYFLGKKIMGKWAGVALCALVMFSPLEIFYSTTSLLDPLAVSLAFISLTIFIYALDRPSLLPASGLVYSLALATRYTVLPVLGIFAAMIYLRRRELLKKENFRDILIFTILISATILLFAGNMTASYGGFEAWETTGSNEIYAVDIEHYSTFFADAFGGEPVVPSPAFYLGAIMFLFSPVVLLLFAAGFAKAAMRRNALVVLLSLLFLAYFAFYSFQSHFQALRYLLDMEVPLLAVAVFGLHGLKPELLAKVVVVALTGFFLFQSFVLIDAHRFRGLSEAISGIPEGSGIYTSYLDSVKYYRKDYLYDRGFSNEFIARLLGEGEKGEPQKIFYINRPLSELKDEIDYVVVNRKFFSSCDTSGLEEFGLCREIKDRGQTIIWVYGKGCQHG